MDVAIGHFLTARGCQCSHLRVGLLLYRFERIYHRRHLESRLAGEKSLKGICIRPRICEKGHVVNDAVTNAPGPGRSRMNQNACRLLQDALAHYSMSLQHHRRGDEKQGPRPDTNHLATTQLEPPSSPSFLNSTFLPPCGFCNTTSLNLSKRREPIWS